MTNKVQWISPHDDLPSPIASGGYEIYRPDRTSTFFKIRTLDDTPFPDTLIGSFINSQKAKDAIDYHLSILYDQTKEEQI
jgi:hypothetical protein